MTIASGIEAGRIAYEELLEASTTRSIFAESWWLDAVTGSPEDWAPNLLHDSGGKVIGAWPLVIVREVGDGRIGAGAPYTPWLGPQLVAKDISGEVRLLEQLAELTSGWAHVEAACMPELDYWTPLSWHGFEQTTRSTWRIAAESSIDDVRAGLRKGTRSTLSAAERDGLVVDEGSVDELLRACESTFALQQVAGVPAGEVLERLARQSTERGRGEVRAVRTAGGELASAGLFVWDDRFTYNLANGRIADSGATGAPTALIFDAISRALARGTGFDFEGSMLKPVEQFVRGFGGTPTPYSVIRRSSPAWQRTVARKRLLKRLLRR